jgi:hypothetical protein
MAEYVTIDPLHEQTPMEFNEEASPLVQEKFAQANDYADQAFAEAESYLSQLRTLFTSAEMPQYDISYDFQEIALDTDIDAARPEPPDDPSYTDIDLPATPTLEEVVMGALGELPDEPGDMPAVDFAYDESTYYSALTTYISSLLTDWVQNGGTGLDADVEEAIWDRERGRRELKNEAMYDEAETYFSSRGFTLPPGALSGRLLEIQKEISRDETEVNNNISVAQAELAQKNTQFAVTSGLNLDQVQREHFNQVSNRLLERAKVAVEIILRAYESKVTTYAARIEAYKKQVDAEVAKVSAAVSLNEGKVRNYVAQIDAYRARITAELAIIESTAKVYGFKVAGYEADAKVAEIKLNAQIEEYKGRIQQATNQTELTIKEAELILQGYLGALGIQSTAVSTGGNVASQLAASALSAVNATASVSFGVSNSRSDGVQHQTSISNNASLTEAHSYDETKTGAE